MPDPAPLPPAPAAGKVCLVFVFNHRYEANIDKLETLYGERFRHIYHLMPFYRGARPNVIPVYCNSFQYQGYFPEAWRALRAEGFTHFLFVADDLILHPGINEHNALEKLKLGAHSGATPYARPLTDGGLGWIFSYPVLQGFVGKSGAQWEDNLPPRAEAAARIARHGMKADGRLGWKNLRGGVSPRQLAMIAVYLAELHRWRKHHPGCGWLDLPYPLISGGSDFLAVSADAMDEFCHLCGVFAALDLFVEVAAPTALAMACEHVAVEDELGWRPRGWWTPSGLEQFNTERNYEISQLLARFEDDCLYVHPVKLSRWKL